MREILFRGQTRRHGEKVRMSGEKVPGNWVYGGIFFGAGDFSIIYGCADADMTVGTLERNVVYSATVGQYTGLTDKNGVKIFEGDILESHYDDLYPDDSTIETILWDKNGWCIKQDERGDPDPLTEDGILPYSEVIGNIHDNRELLEGGDQA